MGSFTFGDFIVIAMAFLDSKDRIYDVVLTDKGRELLSQNLLDFEFYAFSDEGVDYSGSLNYVENSGSQNFDEYVRRTPMMEAVQYKNFDGSQNLSTFLYTIPDGRKTLPEFVTNFDGREDIIAKRLYFIDKLILIAKKTDRKNKPVSVVMRGTIAQNTKEDILSGYVLDQQNSSTKERILSGKNVVGNSIGPNHFMLNSDTVLDTDSGLIENIFSFSTNINDSKKALSIKKELEVVSGLSRAKIDFTLKSSEGEVSSQSGYLIEVFESGSDGQIIRVFEENIEDILEDRTLKKGFESDLYIDTDATNTEIISAAQLDARKSLRKRQQLFNRIKKRLLNKSKILRRRF